MAKVGDELNLSPDEIDRLNQAFKDEKFLKMFWDVHQEISDPANREKYENDIKLMEQQRGNSIEFIHPEPYRALKTNAGGEQKCYINICGNEKISKPDFKSAVSKDGRRGQCWSLPHSLFPGRPYRDSKGNKCVIYDVVFHPDTLHMAAKNKNFNDMVNSAAIDGIQKTFKVILDRKNVKEVKTKYKGTPHPCVIRIAIPGYEAKETPEQPDPLAFPYPDAAKPSDSNSSFQIQPQTATEPAKPKYTVKYRSVVDLQDYRCSRDSAPSPRPKEIVIVIDLPLLKSVGDTSLEVKGKILQLESKHPAYRLELPLAYPVDEDNGEAKFNKQRRQLTITLPVQPPQEAFLCLDPGQREEERSEVEEEGGEERRGVQGKVKGTEELGMETQESTTEKVVKAELVANGEEQRREEASTSESTSKETTKIIQTDIRDDKVPEGGPESSQMFVTNRRDLSAVSLKQKKTDAGEGDQPAEQVLQTPEPDKTPPSAALREIDAEGNETVISDHSTSAGFTFQNTLMYELD